MSHHDVIVAGTGLAGLTAAVRLAEGGARVLVLSTPAGLERMVGDGSIAAAAATLPPPDAPRPSPDELSRPVERSKAGGFAPLALGDATGFGLSYAGGF